MTDHTTPADLARRDGATPDEAAAIPPDAQMQPIPLRWGLNDVMWGDDDSATVMLSGPDGEPYWLELDAERAAVLREDLAGSPAEQTALRDRIAEALQSCGVYDKEEGIWRSLSKEWVEEIQREVAAVLPATTDQTAELSETERGMLDYALNVAQLRMWDTGKYTAEDQAALVSLRRLTAEQPAAGARQDGAQP